MSKQVFYLKPDGKITAVVNERTELYSRRRKRVSRIEPANSFLRPIFLALRSICADSSATADWTRRWPCYWRVRMLESKKVYGPFACRRAALNFEISLLEKELDERLISCRMESAVRDS